MTRQPKKPAKTKLPKPVDALACASFRDAGAYEVVACHFCVEGWVDHLIDNGINPRAFRVEVRIVPVKPKQRRVRKEKQK